MTSNALRSGSQQADNDLLGPEGPAVSKLTTSRPRAARAALVAVLLACAACKKVESSGAVCGYAEDGTAIDVHGRPDGLYTVSDDRVALAPLVTFDRMKKTGEGLEAGSGKRWVGIHFEEGESKALRDFGAETSERRSARKQLAIVAGGEIASITKLKGPIAGSDVRVSCCNPQACDRWNASLVGTTPRP